MRPESERHVQSVTAALRILEAFDDDHPLRLKDLHERTGLNRSRVIRFAGTLTAAGFLEYDGTSGTYSLGSKVYSLGTLMRSRLTRLSEQVRPALKRLAAASGDTAIYSVRQGAERLVVAREESQEGLRFVVQEGSRRPLHAGATGKVLLAYTSEELRHRLLKDVELPKLTAATPTDADALAREIEAVRQSGQSVSRGEATPHGFAVAVPVFEAGQPGCSALTIAGPLSKLTDTVAEHYADLLRAEADALERILASPERNRRHSFQMSVNAKKNGDEE